VAVAQIVALPPVDNGSSPGDEGARLRAAGGEQLRRKHRVA